MLDRLSGTLLGTALGDALGLPAEGLSARVIQRRFGRVERFHLLGATGFVSDDTEQAALVAQALARHPDDPEGCIRSFRRSLLGWFCRLPWGIGMATLRACVRIALSRPSTGVLSAGNGAAMRAAIVGVFFQDRPSRRTELGRALAEVTHRDIRAIEGALYVAELAAACARCPVGTSPTYPSAQARHVVIHPELAAAIDRAADLARDRVATTEAAAICGCSGFVVHTVAFATYCFLRYGETPLLALTEAVSAGGDTDSVGAVVGAWLGALHGESGLPEDLMRRIHDGPFGPSHLRALGNTLARLQEGHRDPVPAFSPTVALARNLALYPVVIAHGLRRLLPPY